MGVIYSLCCANHREQLRIGKTYPGGASGAITSNLVDVLRRELQDWEDTPIGRAQLDRLLALIGAFIQRHRGCYVVIGADRADAWERRAASSGHPWVIFSIFEDGPFWEPKFGRRQPIVDVVLRDEIRDQRLRRYQAVGQEDKAKLLDDHGDLDVLQYMKSTPLRPPVTDQRAIGLCVECGGHGACSMCGGHGMSLSGECPLCTGTGVCRGCNGTGLIERTDQ